MWDAWRNDTQKDEYRVQLEGPEKEWWADTELGLLRVYQFPGHVTTSDGSVGAGSMGTGFVWLDRSKCGSERIGRKEEGTSSGRAEMGAYVVILRPRLTIKLDRLMIVSNQAFSAGFCMYH